MNATQGPAWVASVVNAVGESQFWNSTAIFIIWDDWGGWFDPVQPVYEDYDGLGFRVPLIVISPYAKKGYVTHVQYETASVVRFIEDNVRPRAAGREPTRAPPIPPATRSTTARSRGPFKQIPGSKPPGYWQRLDRAAGKQGKPPGIIGDD